MHQQQFYGFRKIHILMVAVILLLIASPAMAHHGMGGTMPATFWQGLASGLAHPVIGFDHFAFIVAVGLVAALKDRISIAIAFLISTMLGAGLHIFGFSLPLPELFISGSILGFGSLLAVRNIPKTCPIVLLALLAGMFHGYAYGESVFGAETTSLVAYIIGFTAIQAIVSGSSFAIARSSPQHRKIPAFRPFGLILCGIGAVLLYSQLNN